LVTCGVSDISKKIEKISSLVKPSVLGAIGVHEELSFDSDKKFP